MKHTLISLAVAAAALTGAASASAQKFSLSSADLPAGKPVAMKHVFNGFGCTGENISPALRWKNAPAGTKGFAVMVHDPDAPTGGASFWHWVVVNLPASATGSGQASTLRQAQDRPSSARTELV